MKLHAFGHASYLVETASGAKILLDPVLGSQFQQGLFSPFPGRVISLQKLRDVSAVLLSHRHQDHFDVASLSNLPRTARVLMPRDSMMVGVVKALGFSDVTLLSAGSPQPVLDLIVTPTPSIGNPAECGFLLSDGTKTIWNQVDTAVSPALVHKITRGREPIDLAILRWQPLNDGLLLQGGTIDFPYTAYFDILKVAGTIRARRIALGACGFRYRAAAAWLNGVVFPQSRERALADFSRIRGCGPDSIWALDPGDLVDISSPSARIRRNASELVRRHGKWADDALQVVPWPLVSVACKPHRLAALAARMSALFKVWCMDNPDKVGTYRAWDVVYLLRIHAGRRCSAFSIDFRHQTPRVSPGEAPSASIICNISADGLAGLLDWTTTWERVLLGGGFFQWHRIYRVTRGKVQVPKDLRLDNPIFHVLPEELICLGYYFRFTNKIAK